LRIFSACGPLPCTNKRWKGIFGTEEGIIFEITGVNRWVRAKIPKKKKYPVNNRLIYSFEKS